MTTVFASVGQEIRLTPLDATKVLTFSGSLSVLFAALLGTAMLIPLQPWGRAAFRSVNFKQLLAAHLDWVMLGLMQGLAAGLVAVFELAPSSFVVWAMVLGAWLNPLPYVFRAFGINAFSFSGPLVQRTAAALGGVSSALIVLAWTLLLVSAWGSWA